MLLLDINSTSYAVYEFLNCALTFKVFVVDVTCLASPLSPISVSSAVPSSDEALGFFLSLLDLHWISVNKPGYNRPKQFDSLPFYFYSACNNGHCLIKAL